MTPEHEPAEDNWTTAWPTEPGWYWTCIPDAESEHRRNVTPTQVVLAGTAPDTHVVCLRGGHFFYKAEQQHAVWWLPLPAPEEPTT